MNHPHDRLPSPPQPAFDELGRLSFAGHSLGSVLQKVTELAAQVLRGNAVSSVTIVASSPPRWSPAAIWPPASTPSSTASAAAPATVPPRPAGRRWSPTRGRRRRSGRSRPPPRWSPGAPAPIQRAEHPEAALDSRAVTDQAEDILMERLELTADGAFQVPARVSRERNVKVREVALQFVETGDLHGL